MKPRSTMLALLLLLAVPGSAQGIPRPPSDVTVNLGLAAPTGPILKRGDGFFAFVVYELFQGGLDLNGNGRIVDLVVFVQDDETGEVRNLGLATDFNLGTAAGDHLLFLVDEEDQGPVDLNGDGDDDDRVAHLYDHRTGHVTNLGLAASPALGTPTANRFAWFSVPEGGQGQDLNGDGDLNDGVLHFVSLQELAVRNLGIAAGFVRHDDNRVVLSVSERHQAETDLNGDGDVLDYVLHAFTLERLQPVNLGLAVRNLCDLRGSHILAYAREHEGGQDLNGDGDQTDLVPLDVDVLSGAALNTGVAATTPCPAYGRWAAFHGLESQHGTDLNGDGDTQDIVPHVVDSRDSTVLNLGLAATKQTAGGPYPFLFENGLLSFWVSEYENGFVDLNGNGSGFDNLLFLYDPESGTTTNLGVAAAEPDSSAEGDFIAFSATEGTFGGVPLDLNGDGDALDTNVVHLYDHRAGTILNLGWQARAFLLSRGVVLVLVEESGQGVDLNGDGDMLDNVLHAYEVRTGRTRNTRLDGEVRLRPDTLGADGRAVVVVREYAQGEMDLNGDGDAQDPVIHVVGPLFPEPAPRPARSHRR